MDDDGAIAPVGGAHEAQLAALVDIGKSFLLVTRRDTFAVGYNPNLQEMHRLGLRVVELTVTDPETGRHDLPFPRSDHRSGADAVLVLERTFEDVGDDLHVLVPVGAEALAG